MEGANLIELVNKYNNSNFKYRCLVESAINHEMAPEDPLTSIILKGAQGVATQFWFYSGNWWTPAMVVNWDSQYVGDSLVYIEIYRRRNKVKKPITEIKFLREIGKEFILPEQNPLIIHPDDNLVADYFKKIK